MIARRLVCLAVAFVPHRAALFVLDVLFDKPEHVDFIDSTGKRVKL